MTLGDYITWATFLAGAYALGVIAWRRYGSLLVSSLSPADDSEIMSRTAEPVASEVVSPRTDDTADGRTEPVTPALKPETVDGARWLRERGVSRDEARAWLRQHGYSLGNDTWAAAKPALPADDDLIVTPYAGRVTRKSYYPADPELEYQEPQT